MALDHPCILYHSLTCNDINNSTSASCSHHRTCVSNFKDGEKIGGIWAGELTGLRNNNFLMVYSLQEQGEPNLYGLVQVPFSNAATQEMSGIWSVLGKSELEGNITYKRKARGMRN